MEHIIFKIAENDYPDQWTNIVSEIHDRLKSPTESHQITGLIVLKNLLSALRYTIDDEREPLQKTVDLFFPIIETLLQNVT